VYVGSSHFVEEDEDREQVRQVSCSKTGQQRRHRYERADVSKPSNLKIFMLRRVSQPDAAAK
jgi:hypothetical protein